MNLDLTHLGTDPLHKRMDFQRLVHHDGKYLKSGWEKFYEKSHIKYRWNSIYYKNMKLRGCPQKLKSNSLHSNLMYVHIYANTFVSYVLLPCSINYFNGPEYINNQQILVNIYDVFYSQCSHQHVSVGIPAISRVIMCYYKNTNIQMWLSQSLCNN